MFYVYVLWSASARRMYVGSTQDVEDRLARHNRGASRATRHGVPWILIHSESFPNRSQAIARERYYKTGKGRDELRMRLPSFAIA